MRFPLVVTTLLTALSSEALASPTIWQRARNPAAARAEIVTREMERYLDSQSEADRPDLSRDLALGAVAVGNLGRAEELPGARLHCLFGIALTRAGLYRRAHNVFKRALSEGPQGPFGGRCFFDAAIAAAHLGQTELEIEALTRTIELDFAPERLATAYCNRAESWMRKGDLARAIADFKRGITLGVEPAQQALCYYGLAVTLDRNGDTPSAWRALGIALRIQLPLHVYPSGDALDLPSVFFVPAYEIHYYKALSHMARAREPSDDDDERPLRHYERALRHWEAYLAGGEKAADPWLTQARLHAATCRRMIDEAGKSRAKTKAKKATPRRFAEPPPP